MSGAALPERWQPPEHDTAGTAWLPMIPAYIDNSRHALAEMEYAEDADEAVRRAQKLIDYARLADWPTAIINQATLLRYEASVRLADLVDEGQARGEIAERGRPAELSAARTFTQLGLDRRLVSEGRSIRDDGVLEIARERAEQHPDQPLGVRQLHRRLARVQRERARTENAARTRAAMPALPSDVDLREGPFQEVLADIRDVDLVFTDPPYLQEFMPIYSDLSAWAAHALKPGGVLIAYCGQYHLAEAYARLSEHLDYLWQAIILQTAGPSTLVHARRIHVGYKALLLFSRGDYKPNRWINDTVTPGPRTNESTAHHRWQQDEEAPRYYIEVLTHPGDLVADPFLGSGAFALVAKQLGRRVVGAELDPEAYATALSRLA